MSVIRGSCLLGFRELVADLGGGSDLLLRAAGIRPNDAGDHDVFITYRSLVLAVESAAKATSTPDFGRQLALRQGIDILGPLGVAARTSPTMAEGLRTLSVYLSAYSPSIYVGLHPLPDEDRSFFEFRIVPLDLPPSVQTLELSLGTTLAVLRFIRGAAFEPLTVHLPHAPTTSRSTYRDFFSCQPIFEDDRAGFTLRASDLSAEISEDIQAHSAVVRYLEGIVSRGDQDNLRDPVQRLVQQLLPTGAATMPMIAKQFALHPKTLQRRLRTEGTTFGALLEESRQQMVEHLLRNTDLTLTQVARELGYSEQSVLSRSCVRWFGTGPADLRDRLQSHSEPDSWADRQVSPAVKGLSSSVKI